MPEEPVEFSARFEKIPSYTSQFNLIAQSSTWNFYGVKLKKIVQDWVYAGSNKNAGVKFYVKSSYVSKDGGIIKIWRKTESKTSTVKKNGKALTYTNTKELDLIFVDCSNRRIKFGSTTLYNSRGDVIESRNLEEYELKWHDVVPDSVGESILNKVNELFN